MSTVKYLKVKDEEHLIRDADSKAILNTDLSAVKRHDLRLLQVEREKRRENEINSIKQDITELKDMIRTLLSR